MIYLTAITIFDFTFIFIIGLKELGRSDFQYEKLDDPILYIPIVKLCKMVAAMQRESGHLFSSIITIIQKQISSM